jgi:tRNA(fMet)-specific endonuclease VapC
MVMYFLDTNICIYHFKGKYKSIAERFAVTPQDEIKIPIVVKAELWYGAEKSQTRAANRQIYENFVALFEVVNIDDATVNNYARVRVELEKSGNIIGTNDLWIAAIVLAHNGILVTHNTREFSRINGLQLADWVN